MPLTPDLTDTFNKPVTIKEGIATFTHGRKTYYLKAACFAALEGKTVLINSAFEVFRSDRKIGDATPA